MPREPVAQALAARLVESSLKSLEISGRWGSSVQIALTSTVMVGRPTQARSRSVGRYELLLELGKSPLGSLWLGKANTETGPELLMLRRVQLTRELGAEDRDLLAEAARWSLGVSGDSVVKNLDVVVEQGEVLVVSEQHAGETLRSLLRLSNFKRQAIPSSIAARICLDVCRGLESALEHAVLSPRGPHFVSGGLLPDSILVCTDGQTRLLDVGLAATWCGIGGVADHPEVTAYRAPEALSEGHPGGADPRSDVFTLGTLLWEMLSGGRRLFLGSSHSGVVQRVLTHPIPPVAGGTTNEPAPAPLLEIMGRALERDPSRRFPTLSALTQALLARSPAEPETVAEYVNRIAKSALDSRKRVVERALRRSAAPPALAQPRKASSGKAAKPASVVAQPRAPAAATPQPAARPAVASVRPPAGVRDGGFVPPLAKPLPLPAQAKLGVEASGGARPPPPLPEPPSSPENDTEGKVDPSASVRAADIMRALAVEDAPDSEQAATVRNPQASEQARRADRAVSEKPPPVHEPVSAVPTVPGDAVPKPASATGPDVATVGAAPAAVAPQRWQPRPKQDTSVGIGPDLMEPVAPPALATTPAEILSQPGSEAPFSDRATTTRPLAAAAVPAPDIPGAPAVPVLGASRDDGQEQATQKPAAAGEASTKRVPVALLAGAAAAALLLVIGLVFAIGDGEDEVQTKAAVPEHVAAGEKQPKADKPHPPPAPEAAPEKQAKPVEQKPEDSAEPEKAKPEEEQPSDAKDEPAKDEPAKAAPRAVTRPKAVAPRSRPAPRAKRKAKRTFIPSGI